MNHQIKHDYRVKVNPFILYCNGKMVASALIANYLNRCPICDITFKKLPLSDI